MKDLLTLKNLSSSQILDLVALAEKVKKHPKRYKDKLRDKDLLMIFSKPSLRTHLSFDIAMHKLGGHAIFYSLSDSVLGKKESVKDFSKVIARYVDVVMARLYEHEDLEEMAEHSEVPLINGLTNYFHPCQILGDLLTIKEKLGKLKDVKLTFIGDSDNNVTHSLIAACSKVGIELTVCCPNKKEFLPNKKAIGNLKYRYEKDPKKAVKNADVIYSDSWMSYHIPKSEKKERMRALKNYQANGKLMKESGRAKFMHCLPATRGVEVTDEVMDSKNSIVYDQAENRVYAEQAVLLKLISH